MFQHYQLKIVCPDHRILVMALHRFSALEFVPPAPKLLAEKKQQFYKAV